MSKSIFITGGTGFLGKRVIKRLKKESYVIFGLARSEKSQNILIELGVKPILGSMENISSWKNILKDIDIVVHCAAPVEFWGSWEKFESGIIEATVNLYEASVKGYVKRFIYISSESVLQNKKDLINITENESYPKEPNSFYGKSKMLAEKYILAQNNTIHSVIIRPTFIWGKGVKALNSIIEKIKSNDFMWINSGESLFEMVHVDNVAESIALACLNGKDKDIYFVTDDNTQTVNMFLTKLVGTQNIELPKKNIPKWLANSLANIIEFIWIKFKLKSTPPITRFDVAFVAMDRKYDISKIKKELGYTPVINENEGLRAMK